MRRAPLFPVAATFFMGCGLTFVDPVRFPAQYEPQGGKFDAVPACASIRAVRTFDARADSGAGKRVLEADPTQQGSISMDGDARAMLYQAAYHAFELAALPVNRQSKTELKLSLVSVRIVEKAGGALSGYDGDLVLDAAVMDAATHQAIWEARKSGHGHNAGAVGSEVNFQETVNRALEDALGALLRDGEFARVICNPEGASAKTSSSLPGSG